MAYNSFHLGKAFLKRFYLFTFRESGRNGEKHLCVRDALTSIGFLCMPPTGDLAASQASALAGNRTGDLSV